MVKQYAMIDSNMTTKAFQRKIWNYYHKHKRSMPWRTRVTPYYVFVSEIMLQQTQVSRVLQIFPAFIKEFPTITSLAQATPAQVLKAWQGLGYNRRALYLHRSAQIIKEQHKGIIPKNKEVLQTLPGVGPNTAGSLCAFAFNQPTVFIETNIRSVCIHHFFKNAKKVSDKEILVTVRKTLDTQRPREWYWALMDYGTELKRKEGNPNKKSAHYVRQSTFKGSSRQLRGMILRVLLATDTRMSAREIGKRVRKTPDELKKLLAQLCDEGFIVCNRARYYVVSH